MAEHDLSLPDPLTDSSGRKVASPEIWQSARRAEVLELFREHVYGRTPTEQAELTFDVFDEVPDALDGTAIRKQIAIGIATPKGALRVDVLLYLPASAEQKPVPVMTLLNFGGNHTTGDNPAIAVPQDFQSKRREDAKGTDPEKTRGSKASAYPVQEIIKRSYGMATAYYGDIDPDFHDGFQNGIHPLFNAPNERTPDSWGAVGAWAWGLSRIMDYLETDRHVNSDRVAVLGHSRLGKTSLWAGAQDERFGMVISNDSGSTGAAIARQKEGETVKAINESFPHWFCDNYKGYGEREDDLPLDQHMLIALAAPRPVYVASATEDHWAFPRNEFLAAVHAGPVYRLFGLEGLGTDTMPPPDTPINKGHIAYHLRTGAHALTAYDWGCYMDFADRHWGESV